MGIAVRDDMGRPLRFPRSLIRAVLGLAVAPLWLAGMIAVLLDTRRRGLLDMVVRTVVVYGSSPRVGDASPAQADDNRT